MRQSVNLFLWGKNSKTTKEESESQYILKFYFSHASRSLELHEDLLLYVQ